jgi:hypothetical protein
LAPEFRDFTIFDEIFANFFVFRGTSCRMQNFTQKMISVGILAAVFLFLLGSLQQHYSTTFLPITWAPGVRIQPSKDHFEALFQRNAFLQSSTLVDSFQPAGRADWPPDPWHLLGHFGSFPPPTHATLPQNFSQSLDNSWKGGSHVLVPRSQASLTFCPHDRVVCHRFSNTSHGLVDLGTVGAFPHACLDLALDFCGQPLAWLECWDNISHARECNHTVWGGTHAVCFFGNGSFGLEFGLGQVRGYGIDGCMDYCFWFLGEDLPLVALPQDTFSRCSIHGFPRDRSSRRLHFWSTCFADTPHASRDSSRFCKLPNQERRESHAVGFDRCHSTLEHATTTNRTTQTDIALGPVTPLPPVTPPLRPGSVFAPIPRRTINRNPFTHPNSSRDVSGENRARHRSTDTASATPCGGNFSAFASSLNSKRHTMAVGQVSGHSGTGMGVFSKNCVLLLSFFTPFSHKLRAGQSKNCTRTPMTSQIPWGTLG